MNQDKTPMTDHLNWDDLTDLGQTILQSRHLFELATTQCSRKSSDS